MCFTGCRLIRKSFSIPIIGYVLRLVTGILNLPAIICNIETLQARSLYEFDLTHTALAEIGRWRDDDIKKIVKRFDKVEESIRTKADVWLIEQLKERKADHAAIEEVAAILKQDVDKLWEIYDATITTRTA